jgi:pSer/pThr/pTyr-binding forkhead associated (FHA) protein
MALDMRPPGGYSYSQHQWNFPGGSGCWELLNEGGWSMDVSLVYFKENGERKDFPLKEGTTTVGRKDECDYRIPLSQVSREHCQFELSDEGLTVRDLNSSNGTYVNNKRVAKVKLKPGDHVVIGPVVFTVQIDGFPPDPKPVKVRVESLDKKRTGEDLADSALAMSDADDKTRKTDIFDEDEDVDSKLAQTDLKPSGDSDPLEALEALAGSKGDSNVDPFADLDEEEDEKK